MSYHDSDQDKEVVLQTVSPEEIGSYLSSELGNIISNNLYIEALYDDINYQNLDICQINGEPGQVVYLYMDTSALQTYYINAEVFYDDPQFSGYYIYKFGYDR